MKFALSIGTAALALGIATSVCAQQTVKFYGTPAARKTVDVLHGRPAFELEGIDWAQGTPRKMADLKGKVVLLDFTAQW